MRNQIYTFVLCAALSCGASARTSDLSIFLPVLSGQQATMAQPKTPPTRPLCSARGWLPANTVVGGKFRVIANGVVTPVAEKLTVRTTISVGKEIVGRCDSTNVAPGTYTIDTSLLVKELGASGSARVVASITMPGRPVWSLDRDVNLLDLTKDVEVSIRSEQVYERSRQRSKPKAPAAPTPTNPGI